MKRDSAAWPIFAGLIALGAMTPLSAHALGARCWVYLPAHVPALLAGLTLGPLVGGLTGFATILSDVLFGGMVSGLKSLPLGLEIFTYGLVAGLLGRRAHSYGMRLLALGGAMLVGRLVYLVATFAALPHKTLAPMLTSLFLVPWPGIVVQVVALPLIAPRLARVRLGRGDDNPGAGVRLPAASPES